MARRRSIIVPHSSARRSAWPVLFTLLIAGCAEPPPTASTALRLWRDLGPVVEEHPRERPPVDGVLRSVRFDASDELTWHFISERTVASAELVDGAVRMSRSMDGHYLAILPLPAAAMLSVRVRVRADGKIGEGTTRVGEIVELRELPDPGAFEAEAARHEQVDDHPFLLVTQIARFKDLPRHSLSGVLGAEATELTTSFPLNVNTRGLALTLETPRAPGPEAIVIEEVVFERRSLAAYAAAGGALPEVTSLETTSCDAGVRARLDRDEREALMAIAPSRFTWELPASESERLLDLALGVRPCAAGVDGEVRFRVEVARGDDVDVLLDEVLAAPADAEVPAWRDRRLPLAASPGGPLVLTLATDPAGGEAPVALFGHPVVRSARADGPPNVVVISLDTLRPDRLGCYGADPSPSERIDRLAARSLLFRRAYSTSAYTLPSHASLMTGQHPAFHGARNFTDKLSGERSPLLARILGDAGWVTAAFTGGGFVSADFGFAEGFDRYSHNDPVWSLDTERGRRLARQAKIEPALLRRSNGRIIAEWIRAQPKGMPFFLFVHTYICHGYAPSGRWLEQFGLPPRHGGLAPEDRFAYYDATIAMADHLVGRIENALAAAGLADDTILVVTSDHGEEFGEHGEYGHAKSLHEVATRIPLVVHVPWELPRVVEEPVSLVDLAPWILREAGLPPDPRMDLRPPLGPDDIAPPRRSRVVMELETPRFHERAILDASLKLHLDLAAEDGATRLYDLDADPTESRDLAAARPADVERLRAALTSYDAMAAALGGTRELDDLDPEVLADLKRLGYLGDE